MQKGCPEFAKILSGKDGAKGSKTIFSNQIAPLSLTLLYLTLIPSPHLQILEQGKILHHGQNGVEGERSLKTVKATEEVQEDVDLVASRSRDQDIDPADGDVTSTNVSVVIGESLAEHESDTYDEVENTDEWYCSIQ